MKEKRFRQLRQRKGEAEQMVKAGFPKCFGLKIGKISEHCNSCLKSFRRVNGG